MLGCSLISRVIPPAPRSAPYPGSIPALSELHVSNLSSGEMHAERSEVQEHLQLSLSPAWDTLGFVLGEKRLGHRGRDTMMLTQRDIHVDRQWGGYL